MREDNCYAPLDPSGAFYTQDQINDGQYVKREKGERTLPWLNRLKWSDEYI
jgi:hypothetical protein